MGLALFTPMTASKNLSKMSDQVGSIDSEELCEYNIIHHFTHSLNDERGGGELT